MSDIRDYTHRPWKEWTGGECPLKEYEFPEVTYRSGGTTEMQASKLRWTHTGAWNDVLRYRTRYPVAHGIAP